VLDALSSAVQEQGEYGNGSRMKVLLNGWLTALNASISEILRWQTRSAWVRSASSTRSQDRRLHPRS
jgi:3-hydroxyisobutyrate dehydrogenase-like beta-hydroxyacid dehydrogenase